MAGGRTLCTEVSLTYRILWEIGWKRTTMTNSETGDASTNSETGLGNTVTRPSLTNSSVTRRSSACTPAPTNRAAVRHVQPEVGEVYPGRGVYPGVYLGMYTQECT